MLTFGLAANAQILFSEDFESVTTSSQTGLGDIPAGWTLYEDDLTNYSSSQQDFTAFGKSWKVYNMSDWGQLAMSITYTMEGTACDRWLITPAITIPENGDYKLVFDQIASQYSEHMSVKVSTTNTEKASFTQTLMDNELLNAGASTRLFDLSSFAGQTIYIAFIAQTADGLYTAVDNVEVKVVAPDDISAVDAYTNSWTAQNALIPIHLTVFNEGSDTLRSFDIAYTVNNSEELSFSVTDLSVAPFTYYTHFFQATTEGLGENVINITVSNPNGAEIILDNNTASCITYVYDPSEYAQRNSLLEHFTTGKCVWCPYGHQRLSEAIQGMENRIVWVSHHIGYYTDVMTLSESNQIGNMFGLAGAPMMMLDRNAEFAIGSNTAIGSVGDVDEIRAAFEASTNTPSIVSIELSNLNYEPQSRQLTVTVSGTFLKDYTGATPHITLWATEDGIIASQADAYQGTQQNYEHNHVLRALVNGIWGEENGITTTTAGSTFSRTFTYTLPNHIKANKCRLAAFVNEFGTGASNRKVLNATQSDYLMTGEDPTVGINDVEASINVVTYPNPATEMVYVTAESAIRSYQMVDAMGRQVMSHENLNADILELNVSELAAGIYFITITTDHGTATQRVSVAK